MSNNPTQPLLPPKPLAPTEIERAQLDFLWKEHTYLSDFVKFADAKCGFIITANFAYTTLLFSSFTRFRSQLPPTIYGLHRPSHIAAAFVLVCLFTSVSFAGWAIYPRLPNVSKSESVYWAEIAAAFRTADLFVLKATGLLAVEAVTLMAQQVYYTARVCKRKHLLVQGALTLLAFGVALSAIVIIFATASSALPPL